MKKFFEVFDSLNLPKEIEALVTDTYVTRVTITRDRKLIRIHILSAHLIDKRSVYALEKAIKEQLFGRKEITVRIAEEFHLSAQYNPRTLYDLYRDSILLEMKNYDIVLYNMLTRGKLSWTADDTMSLTVPESNLYKTAAKKLEAALHSIFEKRCHLELLLDMHYEARKMVAPEQLARDYVPGAEVDEEAAQRRRQALQQSEDFMDTHDPFNLSGMARAAGDAIDGGGSSGLTQGNAASAQRCANPASEAPAANANARNTGAPQREGGSGSRFGGIGGGNGSFQRRKRAFKMSENEEVLYGRYFEGDAVKLEDVDASSGNVIVAGQIFLVHDPVHTRTGKNILKFDVTDFTDSISVKIFVEDEDMELAQSFVKPGTALKIKGTVSYDSFDKQVEMSFIDGIVRYQLNRAKREDRSPEKRVELHLHTKMSDMDGVTDVNDYIDTAISFGMKAMAITDHGVVQAFPDANIYLKKIKHDKDFKLIYGCEGYLVDDLETIVQNEKGQGLDHDTVVFDIETTGFSAETDHIIEIGAVKLRNNEIVDRMDVFVNPGVPIPFRITQLTSIDDSMVMDADPIEKVLPDFLDWCGDAVIVAHNAGFDTGFVAKNAKRLGLPYAPTILDTVSLSRLLLPQLNRYKLDTVAKELGVSLEHHHRAVDDAACTAEIYMKEIEMVRARGAKLLSDIDHLEFDHAANVMKLPSYHIVLLAKNDVGRINLYRLISESHLKYFKSRPRIPKSLLRELREGLIIGSACVAGEVFQAMTRGADEQQLMNIASFYDYLEVQPLGNNSFMIASDKYTANSTQDLIDYNLKIIDIASQLGKPVCATCDCHYVDEEDDIYRKIIQAGRGFDEEESDAKLYFRTTQEMLDEFSYLEPEKAKEIVIDNPNMIADMCDKIRPVRPDKCPPVIEHSDETLRQICHETAHRIYGPELPKIVSDRLETELNSIISNGYSVMYIIAQKLVDKSKEDGYLVGSRGSVGSSFAATMAHITEVNPLSPHYVCPKCYWYDFDSPEVKKYSGMAGCDMPPKKCPKCGTELNRMGFDIPFETFLGFNGDKEPDIDLNFSGEYQAKAHAYTGVIFGDGHTFKAGTIGTLADKTAFGMVKKYYEEKGIDKRSAEIDRLVQGCVGVRRTTGQHPGGIVVLPHGEEINTFTPVQHPANDMQSPIITTHFDYHKIDHNLLKLDILGHDDPTMIRRLQDLTGIDPVNDIPLDNKEVMSLFASTEALHIRPEDIHGVKLGCLGIPEFGTSFAMQMVEDTKPKYLSDLVRISGLSHGTDVYLNNAQDLIKNGTTTLQEAICCRDDIMVYLMHKGMDPGESFTIMEFTRKHKGLKDEWCQDMLDHGVPQWYIDACKKIKYMFPKAHAAAYVMMAWRVAYCKVFYPVEYYTAYYSIRADGFDYDKMCGGIDKLRYYIDEYMKIPHPTNTEAVCLRDMKICEEMYARGIEFAPLDIYKAKAKDFTITPDRKIMPSFTSMAGLGEAVAQGIEDGAKSGARYLSKDDFMNRTHCPKGFVDKFSELGLLGDIPSSNQMSIFDMLG